MTSRIGAWMGDRVDRLWNWYHSGPFRYAERVTAPLGVAVGSLYGLEQGLNVINDSTLSDPKKMALAAGAVAGTAALNATFNAGFLRGLYNQTARRGLNFVKNRIFRRFNTPDFERKDWRSLRSCLDDYNDNQAIFNPDCNGFGSSLFRYGKTLAFAGLIGLAALGTAWKNNFSIVNTGRNIVAGIEEVIHSPLEGYGASEDLQTLIDRNGLDEEDVEYLTRVQNYECGGCTGRERGAIMRVAYNRANDSEKKFSGDTIKEVVSKCVQGKNNWNCGDYGFEAKMADSNKGMSNPTNKRLAVSAIDFLTGRGDEARGAYAVGCRDSFARLDVIRGSDKWHLKNPLKIGYHTFHGPLTGCEHYPQKRKEPRVHEEPKEKIKGILLVGDSNTGNGAKLAPTGTALAEKLKERYLGSDIKFIAKDGATAETFLKDTDIGRRYKANASDADLVVYSLGTNYGAGRGVKATSVEQLIGYRKSGTKCIWIGAPYEERSDINASDINKRLERIVTSEGCQFIDPVSFNSRGDIIKGDRYKAHLNPQGAEKFAAGVIGAIFSEPVAKPEEKKEPDKKEEVHDKQRILLIGDSHTVQSYGATLDSRFRAIPDTNVRTYGAGGRLPAHWLKKNFRQGEGSLFIDEDGKRYEPYSGNLSLKGIIDSYEPNNVVINLGTTFVNFADPETPQSLDGIKKDVGSLAAIATEKGAKCYWIGPPKLAQYCRKLEHDAHGKEYCPDEKKYTQPQIDDMTERLVGALKESPCAFIDARKYSPVENINSDGIHYAGRGGEEWAKSMYETELKSLLNP